MNTQPRRWSRLSIALSLLLFAAACLLLLVLNAARRQQTGQAVPPPAQEMPAVALDSPLPTPFVVGPTIGPTWTPWPTVTPWPSPTLHPGATTTPLPPLSIPDNPSGRLFYFSRSKLQGGPGGFDEEGDIYETQMDAVGKNDLIRSVENKGLYRLYASWDKSRIAFVNTTMGGDKVAIYDPSGDQSSLAAKNDDFRGSFLDWHPNGKELLFKIDMLDYPGLWLLNLETNTRKIIVPQDPLYIIDAAISPNGQQIIFTQQKGWQAQTELWRVFADGSKLQQISSDGSISGLSWSPDGKNIAYIGNSGLCIIAIENPQCRWLSSNAKSLDFFTPVWSPNGRHIAYVGYRASDALLEKQAIVDLSKDWNRYVFSNSEVFIVDTDSGEQKTLIDPKSFDIQDGFIDPTWSPDGSMLAFAGYSKKKGLIVAVNLNDLKPHIIATHNDIVRFPAWTK